MQVIAVHQLIYSAEYVLEIDIWRDAPQPLARNRRPPLHVEQCRPRTAAAIASSDLPQVVREAISGAAGAVRHERAQLTRKCAVASDSGIWYERAVTSKSVAVDVALNDRCEWKSRLRTCEQCDRPRLLGVESGAQHEDVPRVIVRRCPLDLSWIAERGAVESAILSSGSLQCVRQRQIEIKLCVELEYVGRDGPGQLF